MVTGVRAAARTRAQRQTRAGWFRDEPARKRDERMRTRGPGLRVIVATGSDRLGGSGQRRGRSCRVPDRLIIDWTGNPFGVGQRIVARIDIDRADRQASMTLVP